MLRALLKKQFMEVFRGWFYSQKTGKGKSKSSSIISVVAFIAVMVLCVGAMFFGIAMTMCKPLAEKGYLWLYWLIFAGLAGVIGVFCSAFSTFASLYKPRDNDLLLSSPIPVSTILIARLSVVYLTGFFYSACAFVPAIIVSVMQSGRGIQGFFGAIWLFLLTTIVVFSLSCFLGFVVAKISQKLKNKQFATVIISLVLIGAYYFLYFKGQEYMTKLVENIDIYGNQIKAKAYPLFVIGSTGDGNLLSTLIATAAVLLLFFLCMLLLKKTFMSIATFSTGTGRKKSAKTGEMKTKSAFSSLVSKEFGRITSSANYMLNCGFGVVFYPIIVVALILKKDAIVAAVSKSFPAYDGITTIICFCALLFAMSMIDMATPSISLEGKNLWILQSLPLKTQDVLLAKMMPQLINTEILVFVCSLISAVVLKMQLLVAILFVVTLLIAGLMNSLFCLLIGYKFRNYSWTSELVPIKQSFSICIVIFAPMIAGGASIALYFAIGKSIGICLFLLIIAVLLAASSYLMYRKVKKIESLY